MSTREKIALTAIFGVFLFFAAGLLKLQIFEHNTMYELAESNRIRIVPIEAKRGVVYDREGRVIIGNRPSYTLSVVPAEEVKGKNRSAYRAGDRDGYVASAAADAEKSGGAVSAVADLPRYPV